MIIQRKAEQRGHFDHGWLDTWHTFSFGGYQDPQHMGYHSLRVINEDTVQPGEGFGRHGHRDMEILTYVLEGALQHEDSTGGGGVLRNGDVQRMSAGSGVMHSEFNASDKEPVHFLQIWIVPNQWGVPARYDDRNFPLEERRNRLRLIASPDMAEGSLSIYQDARVYVATLEAGKSVTLDLAEGRRGWVQAATGTVMLGHGFSQGRDGIECAGEWTELKAGDGAAVEKERKLTLRAETAAEILVFDLG
jgi:redox-sensitive bicupin YhaK (pirin superfamily)